MREAVGQYQRQSIRSGTDLQIVLECLYETYVLEREPLLSEKNIYVTMVHPFLKMAEGQCHGICMDEIHLLLWKIYRNSEEKEVFMREAGIALEPHRKCEGVE